MDWKKVMVNFDFYNDCCGCGGCYNACPVNAINMNKNEEGFKIPVIKQLGEKKGD